MSKSFKWVSRTGELIGTFTLPEDLQDRFLQSRATVYEFQVSVPCSVLYSFPLDGRVPLSVPCYRVAIYRSYHHPAVPDAFEVVGITPELFEKLPGFTFAPSLAYIQSLLNQVKAAPAAPEWAEPERSQEDLEQAAWQATQDLSA